MSKKILKYCEFINEDFNGGGPSEFSLNRMNSDTFNPAVQVDDASLSQDAFDKQQNNIRVGISRLNDIMKNISNVSNIRNLKSYFTLSEQDIKSLKILKIFKSSEIRYDVYISFIIKDNEYWGCVKNILSENPEFISEVFRDNNELLQTREWKIKTKGVVINSIKKFLQPENGLYVALKGDIFATNNMTGEMLSLKKGSKVEVLRASEGRITIKYKDNYFSMFGDNFIYFNWWFERGKMEKI